MAHARGCEEGRGGGGRDRTRVDGEEKMSETCEMGGWEDGLEEKSEEGVHAWKRRKEWSYVEDVHFPDKQFWSKAVGGRERTEEGR